MFPEWVESQRRPGTTVKKIGDNYYLYSATSKREEGKKYPTSIQSYIGKITEDGIEDARKLIQISHTKAKRLCELCPNVPELAADVILLEVQKEWYFTQITSRQRKALNEAGLIKNDKLVRV